MTKKQLHLVIVTGMSGAGKTVAIQSFEDLGYFTIDNMPPALLPKFLQLVETKDDDHKLALVVDMRSRSFFLEIQTVLDELENKEELDFKILFLIADSCLFHLPRGILSALVATMITGIS